ncbi:unnamed protein product [Chilo suppressalis]|uniref:Uncharacterized protein n=1 Tax=Chilo suppressalis TaxID=168631 RepID=A0ABN8AXY8_CHISP|nr:unnamed protein product [Chilo suppressalis]
MSTMTFGQKQFIPTPPDKGSFPLDHEGNLTLKQMRALVQDIKKITIEFG